MTSNNRPNLKDIPGIIPPRSTDVRTPADDSLIREVHLALRNAQRVSAVPVRVLDLLAAAPVMLRALEDARATLDYAVCEDELPNEHHNNAVLSISRIDAALNLARGES